MICRNEKYVFGILNKFQCIAHVEPRTIQLPSFRRDTQIWIATPFIFNMYLFSAKVWRQDGKAFGKPHFFSCFDKSLVSGSLHIKWRLFWHSFLWTSWSAKKPFWHDIDVLTPADKMETFWSARHSSRKAEVGIDHLPLAPFWHQAVTHLFIEETPSSLVNWLMEKVVCV